MKIIKPELIMCVPGKIFSAYARSGVIPMNDATVFSLINSDNTWFGPRNYLEANTDFLQIIPYIVLRYEDSVAVYERAAKGTEKRLHNLFSVGFGGHIQISDASLNADILDSAATIAAAAKREMEEESIHTRILRKEKHGMILLDDEEVSLHHAGLLEVWTVESPVIDSTDEALKNCRFISLDELAALRSKLESWSKAVCDYLQMTRQKHL